MRSGWQAVVVLVLGWTAAAPVLAQPPGPMMFPPSAPPAYYNSPPMAPGMAPWMYPPGGFAPRPNLNSARMPPRGYPIPGAEDPQKLIDDRASKNPLEMSSEGANAFSDEGCSNEDAGCYFMIGFMALARNGLGNGVVAVLSPNLLDANVLPPPGAPPLLNYNAIHNNYYGGVRGAIGYRDGADAVELFGWVIPGSSSEATVTDRRRIDVPFAQYPFPVGTGIDNSVWLNADQVGIRQYDALGNIEGNYRYSLGLGSEFLLGIRYLDVNEVFSLITDDNGLTVTPRDPRTIATYQSTTHSHIVGPQIGWECENRFVHWFGAGLNTKLFAGANFYDARISVFRGDGLTMIDNKRSRATLSGAWEMGGFVDFLILSRLRARLGYQFLWVFNVPEAHSEVDFNIPENPYGSRRDHGEILYHGPLFELHFAF